MAETKEKTKSIDALVKRIADEVCAEYAASNLQPSELAFTLIDLTSSEAAREAAFRGEESIFPASVVKLST